MEDLNYLKGLGRTNIDPDALSRDRDNHGTSGRDDIYEEQPYANDGSDLYIASDALTVSSSELQQAQEHLVAAILEADEELVAIQDAMTSHAGETIDDTDKSRVLATDEIIEALEISFAFRLMELEADLKHEDKQLAESITDETFDEALQLAEAIAKNLDGPFTEQKVDQLITDMFAEIDALKELALLKREYQLAA